MLGLLALGLSGCEGGRPATATAPGQVEAPAPTPAADQARRIIDIPNDDEASVNMLVAAVQARPGDTLRFACGYYELDAGLVLQTTEDIVIEGCGMDRTVLSFKGSNSAEGILAVNVRGIVVRDLTVLDTPGDGIKLKGVDHGTLERVRTMWSSGGGAGSATPVTADNYGRTLKVACTQPPTRDPENPISAIPLVGQLGSAPLIEQLPLLRDLPVVADLIGAGTRSPDYTPSRQTGRYGIYPVASRNILVVDSEAIGASDAGIYVGQTSNAIIRNSRAAYNVMGFEIENVQGGEYAGNVAECNTGGFLIYDLDGLDQYGYGTRMYDNIARKNNTYNFNSGGFVGNVPAGSGILTLSYDRIDIFNNEIYDNNTGGLIWASYALFPEGAGRPSENQIDWYTEGVSLYDNVFRNNGNHLPPPDFVKILSSQLGDINSLLPYLVGIKHAASLSPDLTLGQLLNPLALAGFRGAHIVWDGLLDEYDPDCPYPVDTQGQPVPEATYAPGKPEYRNAYGDPGCQYNAYKFDTQAPDAPRIRPEWLGCIAASNEFAADSERFINFNGTRGLELLVTQDFDPQALADLPASKDMSALDCEAAYGRTLTPLPPVVIPPFERSGLISPAPTPERIRALCEASTGGAVNFAAAREVNCPDLAQYALFADAQDPRSAPRSGGVPFTLNSKLFSDYATKYRVAFLPPGEQALWRDAERFGANATLAWPVGTILAKTFAFPDDSRGVEEVVETRLLIKRANADGAVRWDGLAYLWETDADGQRSARLVPAGARRAVQWDYVEPDSGLRLQGATAAYQVPHANQCITCHGNDDAEVGAAPIGPKVRMWNRPYAPDSARDSGQARHPIAGRNQLDYFCANGLLQDCPPLAVDAATQVATAVARVPRYLRPGDAGHPAGSDADVEARARAWLEVNCQHCHNPKGAASNTGVYFDSLRTVDLNYGVCKRPTAAGGEGSGGRGHDIVPGAAAQSILSYRIGPEANTAAARMPPIARSVVDEQAAELIARWIDQVVVADESRYPNSTACAP